MDVDCLPFLLPSGPLFGLLFLFFPFPFPFLPLCFLGLLFPPFFLLLLSPASLSTLADAISSDSSMSSSSVMAAARAATTRIPKSIKLNLEFIVMVKLS